MDVRTKDAVAVVVNMDPNQKAMIKKLSLMHGVSMSKLIRAVLADYAERNEDKLRRYDELVAGKY